MRTGLVLTTLAVLALTIVATATPKKKKKMHPDRVHGDLTFARFDMDADPATMTKGGRAVLPIGSDIDSFNPYLSTSRDASEVHSRLFLHLLEEQADYYKGMPTFSPTLLADKYEVDGKTIKFHLREDALWSDGKPVTSDDVEFSWQAASSTDVAWTGKSIVDHIIRIEKIDAHNFVLHYDAIYPDMVMDAKDWRIIPKHVFGKIPFDEWKSYKDWDSASRVVNGPYMVESYKHNEEFVLVPNPLFWNKELPRIQRVHFRVIKDRQTVIEAALSGGLDCVNSVMPKDVKKVLAHPDLRLFTFAARTYYYVGWNATHWIFKDPEIRRAMTHAIDRENIIESIFYGFAKPMASPFISTLWACNKDLEPHEFDPDVAEEILAKKGWVKGDGGWLYRDGKRFEINMSTNSGNTVREQIIQIVQADLREIGVKVNIALQEFNSWGENLKKGKEDAWVGGWSSATKVDPKPTFHSDSVGTAFNYYQYKNPRVDELIMAGRVEIDRAKAQAIWNEFQDIFHKEQMHTPICELTALHALNKRFHNVEMNALDAYFNLKEWFVPKGMQRPTR